MREKDLIERKIRHVRFHEPLFIQSGTACQEVLSRMKQEKRTCVLVCDGSRCIGIFTERDYLTRLLGEPVDLRQSVDEFMSRDPKTLTIEDTVGEAIRMMSQHGFRNIPLVDQSGASVGVLQIRNLIDFLAELYPEEVLNAPVDESFKDKDGA